MQELQRTIKNLEKQSADEEANIKGLSNARERAKSSFFAIMRPRLRAENLIKYASGKRFSWIMIYLPFKRHWTTEFLNGVWRRIGDCRKF